jgi:hypothetical protein
MLEPGTSALVTTIAALLIVLAGSRLMGGVSLLRSEGEGTGQWMQPSFLFDCDDVASPAPRLDPDTELARVVPVDVEVHQRAVLHDVECSCDDRF